MRARGGPSPRMRAATMPVTIGTFRFCLPDASIITKGRLGACRAALKEVEMIIVDRGYFEQEALKIARKTGWSDLEGVKIERETAAGAVLNWRIKGFVPELPSNASNAEMGDRATKETAARLAIIKGLAEYKLPD